jgi:hypothetical protein
MKISFIEFLVLSLLIIFFTIFGFTISEVINRFLDITGINCGSLDADIKATEFNGGGVLAGLIVALWISYFYHQWKNGNKKKNT